MAVEIYYVYKTEELSLIQYQDKYPNIPLNPKCSTASALKILLENACDNILDGHPNSIIKCNALTGNIHVFYCCENCNSNIKKFISGEIR